MKEHQGSGELSSTLEVFCRLVHDALLYMAGYYEYTSVRNLAFVCIVTGAHTPNIHNAAALVQTNRNFTHHV